MPLSVRNSARGRRKNPDEKPPERPGESTSAQVMAPTRMKLRVRRRDNAAGGVGAAAGSDQPEEEEERRQESGGGSRRRKNANNTSVTAAAATAATTSSSSPPSSSTSGSVRAVMAAEEASPDSKCPICLDRFNNLAYLDRCLHRFCFPCIQEWSHNKAECPLCKQPFASILHSVRAEDDFKEYTLRPAPTNSSVAATVAMVAAMASAARNSHQMRLMLRRHRGADGGETTTRRRRRERGGRGRGGGRVGERTGVWEWYLDSPPFPIPPLSPHPAVSPVVAEDSEEGDDLEEQGMSGGANVAERGVIFEGLTGLGAAVAPVAPTDRASRRLMTRLAARLRLQREGGTVRRLRERETVAFRRTLYRNGIRVRGVAGVGDQGRQQRDITAESFHRNPVHLNRLRPWLRRELTVLYGAHDSLVDIVQRIIMARLARHGLEDTPTVEEELRPFLLARTDHFLHELVSFARSPLSMENYDQQAVYEPPAAALELDGTSSSSDSSSVIAISEGEEEERQAGGRSEERLPGGAHEDIIQTGSCLSLAAWDDETPGPSYSTAEPSCSLAPLPFSPAPQEAASEEGGGKQEEEEEGEEECLIVGYKKPIAERTPELVQLSSDTEEEEKEDKKKEEDNMAEKLPLLPSTTPPLSHLPIIPPSTSGAYRDKQDDKPKEKDGCAGRLHSRARSWSDSSGRSRNSVCTLSPATPGGSERRRERESWRDKKQSASEISREKRRRKRSRRRRERSGDRPRKSSTLYNPNRSIYPAMMRHCSHSLSPFHSSVESGSPLPPSPPDSSWEYRCSQVSPLTSSVSSPSRSSSPLSSSPQPLSQTLPTPTRSPSKTHHGEKPGGKRKYKSRHLDSDDKDPTWRPSSSHRREKRRERREKERRRRGRDEGRRRERQRKDAGKDSSRDSSRRRREDRSPSIEIIYEGTITSSVTQPPARKRRRKRQPRTQHGSSPVIITLDSDSSHSDVKHNNSNSSSPLSSQQTVDFSDLPPLPLVHSAGVSGALNAEMGELPADILDRGSDGSETEPAGQSEAAGPIAIDNSDNSDHDVDVENIDESGSLLGSDDYDDKGSVRKAAAKATATANQRETRSEDGGPRPNGENVAALQTTDLVRKRDSEVLSSDSHLLATILNDLKEITAPRYNSSLNFEPGCSSDTRKGRFRDQCEVRQPQSYQSDWLAETTHPTPDLAEERHSNNSRNQTQGFDLQTFHTSIPPLPPLEQQKECRIRGEGKDLPPLLKQASPVRSYNRNTPPPLKHKDAGSPHLLPISSARLRSPPGSVEANPAGVNSDIDLSSNPTVYPTESRSGAELPNQAIPSISTMKRDFTSSLALREELASSSHVSANNTHSSCHLAPTDSPSVAPTKTGTIGIHSMSHKPPTDSHSFTASASGSTSAECLPQLDLNSFHLSKLRSSLDNAKDISSGPRSSHTDSHSVDFFPPIDFHSSKTSWLKDKSAHTVANSRGCRNQTLNQNFCPETPVDLHPSTRVSAESRLTSSDVLPIFINCNNSSTSVFVCPIDSRTETPSSHSDSHPSGKRENLSETLSPSRVSSVPTTGANSRTVSADVHPRNPKSTLDLHSPNAESAGLTDNKSSSLVIPEERPPHDQLPPVDLHQLLPANELSSSFVDEHLNHRASSFSSTLQTLQRKCSSQSKPTAESHLKLLHPGDSDSTAYNHFDSSSKPQIPMDTGSKHTLPVDSGHESQSPVDSHSKNSCRDVELPAGNHITSTSRWNSDSFNDSQSESQSPFDECSASSVWNTHTHSAT